MRKKIAMFAFNGEAMCFVHVLLNALDNAFWMKVTDEPKIDLDAEIEMLKTGLQKIFDAAK